MFLFKKPEHARKTIRLPFIHDDFSCSETDSERCTIDIEAYGEIDGIVKFFYSCFSLKEPKMYDNGDYEDMLKLLRDPADRTMLIELKYKKDTLKSFIPVIESLAEAYNDERFLQLELLGWGINEKSCKEFRQETE